MKIAIKVWGVAGLGFCILVFLFVNFFPWKREVFVIWRTASSLTFGGPHSDPRLNNRFHLDCSEAAKSCEPNSAHYKSFSCLSDRVNQKFSGFSLQQKVLICGVCRDTERAVPNVIKNAEALGSCFKDYAVIIYENNSTDNTAELLARWANNNPHVVFMSETLSVMASSRTERIADARNKVLEIARRPEYEDFECLVMVDLDFMTSWPIEQIIQVIEQGGDWDAISANGVYPNGDYYDRYALRNEKLPFGPELLGDWWRMQLEEKAIRFAPGAPIPVFSAFGGLSIYKRKSILPFSYVGVVTKDLRDYYKKILVDNYKKKKNRQVSEYFRQIGRKTTSKLKAVPIVFVENTPEEHLEDMRRATCCEHVTLHATMAMHGYGRLFLDPQMIFVNISSQTKR